MQRPVATSAGDVVGREAELAAVEEFLAGTPLAPRALVILGEAGVGKTTLWNHSVTRAAALGYLVLSCRPAESETRLSFGGLGDLLDRVDERTLGLLPPPQRRALEVALLRRDAGSAPLDQRTVAVAALSALRMLAGKQPVVLAVDDAQWLDEPTTRVIEHVVRRLTGEPVAVLTAVRTDRSDPAVASGPFQLRREFSADRIVTLQLERLSLLALRRIIQNHTGLELPRLTLMRIHEASGGNPFFAQEIAAALKRGERPVDPGAPLPLPASLSDLLADRIGHLPEPTRDALLYVAALSQPKVDVVRTALGTPPGGGSALATAEESGVIEVSHERIRFTHPLFASAVYSSAPGDRRRQVHRRLAEVVTDIEQQAWHLALSSDQPDEQIAVSLSRAAQIARARGAPGAAARLWELASRRTESGKVLEAQLRAVAAAECQFYAGDAGGARAKLEQVVAGMAPGRRRVRALVKLAEAIFYDGGTVQASELCRRALTETEGDRLLEAELYLRRAWFSTHDAVEQERNASAALRILENERVTPDADLWACVLVVAALCRLVSGGPIAWDDLAHARRLLQPDARSWASVWARTALGTWAKFLDPIEARTLFDAQCRTARQLGDEPLVGHTLMHLAEIDCWLGNWADARREADTSVEIVEQTGQRRWLGFALYAQALVEAHLGESDAARATLRGGLDLAAQLEDPQVAILNLQVAGFLDLSLGDHARADDHLSRAAEQIELMRLAEPARYMIDGDRIEVELALGRVAQAAEQVARLEARVAVAPRPWLVAITARSRALLALAEGDLERARQDIEAALEAHERLPMPFELARTLLGQGRIWLAANQKLAARPALLRAQRMFDELGARLWSEQAAAELARCGLRRGEPERAAGEELPALAKVELPAKDRP
jgi:tetratricopeptide (TPR) repeat protein